MGRKLNSDLALLCVETIVEEGDNCYFPPPLVLTGEVISTDTYRANDSKVPTSEIGSPVYLFIRLPHGSGGTNNDVGNTVSHN